MTETLPAGARRILGAILAQPRLSAVCGPALFVASSCLLVWTKRTIDRRGVGATKARFLRPRKLDDGASMPLGEPVALARILEQIDTSVASACAWLPIPMSCLPRSITAYVLADAFGTRPVHHIGIRARPYYGHAWTQVGDRAIGDELDATGRSGLRVVKRFPAPLVTEVP
jgi:hypothetical protein